MAAGTVIMVSLSPQDDGIKLVEKGTRETPRDYHFQPDGTKHAGLAVAKIGSVDAVELLRATPHLFYPYYSGIDKEAHFKRTPREQLKKAQAYRIITKPKEEAESLLTNRDFTEPDPEKQLIGPSMGLNEETGLESGSQFGTEDTRSSAPKEAEDGKRKPPIDLPKGVADADALNMDQIKLCIVIYGNKEDVDPATLPKSRVDCRRLLLKIMRDHGRNIPDSEIVEPKKE